jgi:hypothetical protein
MDFAMNILLNVFEFLGIDQANQIIIFIIIMGLVLAWQIREMSRLMITAFLVIMAGALVTAIYQIAFNAKAQCVFAYDDAKPVFADSLTRALGWNELLDKNCPTLWVARNEIYQRSGYCFFTPAGVAYFGSSDSCNPEIDDPASEIGMSNVKLISRMERRKGCPSPPSSCKDFGRVSASKLLIGRGPLTEQ